MSEFSLKPLPRLRFVIFYNASTQCGKTVPIEPSAKNNPQTRILP
jgi:hypothetical protein